MPFLRSVELAADAPGVDAGHPFDVPAIAALGASGLQFDKAVTVFVGDNGSGKSTLLEAVAVHQGMNAEGGSRNMRFQTNNNVVSPLHEYLRVVRSPRVAGDAFFLRAESYFNVATEVEQAAYTHSYGGSAHERSHGESFIDLAVHRFGPRSLFLLDEPEAALSVHGQLKFLVRMRDLVAQGCQFVVATHSPMLMAYPGATIYEFTDDGPTQVAWDDIDTVRLTADFLAHPDEFLDELFSDE